MSLSFKEQLIITLIDKAVVGGLLALAAYVFSRSLEAFRGTQALELEAFKGSQSQESVRFAQEQNRTSEEFKSRIGMEIESRRNVRLAVAEVAKRVAAATHSICWTTWPARYSPQEFGLGHFDKYDAEIHLLLSDIVASRVVLAALSPSVHDQLSAWIDKLYDLDVRVGEAKGFFAQDRDRGIVALTKIHAESASLDDDLLEAVTKLNFMTLSIESAPRS